MSQANQTITHVNKPVPEPTIWSKPFWDACKNHELHIQKCSDCKQLIMYPKKYCPHCLSEHLTWIKSKGYGKIYSYSVVNNNPPSFFIDELPYVVAIVELDEGVRLTTNIVEDNHDLLACEVEVEVIFEKANDDITLPKFKLRHN